MHVNLITIRNNATKVEYHLEVFMGKINYTGREQRELHT